MSRRRLFQIGSRSMQTDTQSIAAVGETQHSLSRHKYGGFQLTKLFFVTEAKKTEEKKNKTVSNKFVRKLGS